MYKRQAQERVQNCEVLLEEGPGQLAGLLQSLGIESAAFETNYITVERAAQLRQDIAPVRLEETPDFGKLLLKMRRHKDDYELECLRKAQQITDEAFQVLLGKIRPGVSELDLMMCLGEEMARRGCEKRSFNMIFTSGERTSLPHGDPTIRQVGYGDFVKMCIRDSRYTGRFRPCPKSGSQPHPKSESHLLLLQFSPFQSGNKSAEM